MLGNVLTWILIGVFAGLGVYLLFPGERKKLTQTTFAGISGAFFGGVVFSAIKIGRIAAMLDPFSIVAAMIGSLVLLGIISILMTSDQTEKSKV